MRLTSEALRELYQRETARSARRRDLDCPAEKLLIGAAAGELSRAERDLIADHLATCSDCAHEYRLIRELKPWAEKKSLTDLATSATETGPTRLLHLPDRQARSEQPFWKTFAGSRPFSSYVPVALAVLFFILALVLAAQLISKRRENERLVAQVEESRKQQTAESIAESRLAEATRRAEQAEAAQRAAQEELAKRAQTGIANEAGQGKASVESPLVNVPIFELQPRGTTRGGEAGAITTFEAASDTNLITLILHVNGELSRGGYSVEILDHSGRTIWVGRGLRKSRYNNFTVAIPRNTIPAGDYRLRLYGSRDARRELIEEYAMRLKYLN